MNSIQVTDFMIKQACDAYDLHHEEGKRAEWFGMEAAIKAALETDTTEPVAQGEATLEKESEMDERMTLERIKPTHWMDDRGLVCTAEFMASEKAHGDYQLAYSIPCIKKGRKFVKIDKALTAVETLK